LVNLFVGHGKLLFAHHRWQNFIFIDYSKSAGITQAIKRSGGTKADPPQSRPIREYRLRNPEKTGTM
jgi:hypothetical protein